MNLIDDLINSLTDQSIRLTDILIKTKVLAFKLKNDELKTWVDNELNGYPNGELPEYRNLICQVVGTISNGFKRANNYPIPLMGLEDEIRESIQNLRLHQSISTLDEFVNKGENDKMIMNIPPEMYGYLSRSFDGGYGIEYARREIDRVQVIQTITAVRTKLLDFLLKINEENGEGEDIKSLAEGENKNKVASMFHSSVFGNNTTIIVGDHNNQKVTNTTKGDFEALEKLLLNSGILKKDTQELQRIIKSDTANTEKKEFGPNVKEWITKMLNKAMDGSWKIGLGAAGGLLAKSIGSYYGWE